MGVAPARCTICSCKYKVQSVTCGNAKSPSIVHGAVGPPGSGGPTGTCVPANFGVAIISGAEPAAPCGAESAGTAGGGAEPIEPGAAFIGTAYLAGYDGCIATNRSCQAQGATRKLKRTLNQWLRE